MEEENFDKVPVEERCAHKSWKVRISGYTSLVSIFDDIPSEKNNDWNKYVLTVKNILLENNDPALEKGLEVVLNFVSKAAAAAKILGPIVAGLVKKCVASSRIRTRDLALQICLACIEIEKQKIVTDELLKGTESKNPKISVGCIHILTEIIRNFGTTVIPIEGIFQKLPVLLEDKDQSVRNEAKSLTIEFYRWLGNDLRTNLLKPEILKPQKLAEIVSEIAKIKDRSAVPTRFLRSQKKCQQVEILEVDDLVGYETADDQSAESSEREPLNDITPVEIISQIPENFYSKATSGKWLERKEALENLENILLDAGKIQNGDFHGIISMLVNIISKDANITVVRLAVKCVTYFAQKLGEGFSPYGLVVFRAVLEKLKERKPSVVQTLREAMDSVFKSSTFDLFVDDLSESLSNKNPNVKSEGALFLSRFFSRLSPTSLNKKSLKPLFPALVTCLSDQDPSVRDQSAKALGVAMGVLGEKGLSPLLKDLEKTKLSKIKECAVSFLAETDNLKLRIPNHSKQMECTNSNSDFNCPPKKSSEQLNEKKIVDAPKIRKIDNTLVKSEYKSKESIAVVISEDTIKALSDKDWSRRIQAISDIHKIVNSSSDFSADLGELGPLLHSRMLESNPKISSASINLVTSLAEKIGPPFKDQLRIVLPALLKAVGDVKGPVREVAVSGLTKIGENCGYGEIFRSEFLSESLKSGSNTAKAKLWRWVAENLPKITTKEVPKYELENILPSLFASLEDKNADVRSEASNAVESFLKVLSIGTVISFCDKFYGKSNNSVIKIIHDKQKSGSFPELHDTPLKLALKLSSAKSMKTPSPVVAHKKVTFAGDGEKMPLLDVNNLKSQRVIDEQKHKTAKWDFATPRTEFVDLLKGLMSAANFSSELTKLMYHTDFRCHIKAMDLLTEEIAQNSVGIVCNLDLILRWLTLRFFDGNPTVLSKSLDFVITALEYLKETNYCLLDSEAVAFLPYLVMKLGDSKENIQTKVKEILANLTSVYPVSKLKKFVMDGTRSNIGRQRASCLDVIASYINAYGDSVYLREIDSVSEAVGKLLKDRDPAVKKKAFLVAGMLYDREGEKIMKFIEKHAGEDFRLIEDRIRKYVISKPNTPQKQFKTSDEGSLHSEVTNSQSQNFSAECPPQIPEDLHEPEPEPEQKTEVPNDTCQKQLGTFHWDANRVQKETDDLFNMIIQPSEEIVDIDLEFMKDHPVSFDAVFQRPQNTQSSYSSNSSPIWNYVESIADDDLTTSKHAINYIDMMLNSSRSKDLDRYTDLLIQKLVMNLRKLDGKHYNEVLENYGSTFTLLLTLCNEKRFIEQFSEERLYETLEQLLLIISDYKFSGKDNEIYRKTVNTIILSILENSRKTPLLSALLRMLCDTREPGGTMVSGKLNELCMKCLWKLNRTQAMWDGELDYAVIFSIIRKVLSGFPVPWWKSRPGDMSLRTVKTVLRTMVKLRGKRVLEDVGLDDEYELSRYLSKLAKHMNLEDSAVKPGRHDDMITTAQYVNP